MRLQFLFSTGLLLMSVGSLAAAPITFFGEDLNFAGDPIVATPTNSIAARNSFFTNLTGVGTETFEGFATGASVPLAVVFPGAGTATLSVNGEIFAGNDLSGRFPISGTKYFRTDAGANFTITFSSPISAFGFFGTDIGDFSGALSLSLTGTSPVILNVGNTLGNNASTSGSALYFGFYDTQNTYTSINFRNSSGTDVFGFDNFSVGSLEQVTPMPEPGSYALLAGGLMILLYRKRLLYRT